MKWRIYGRPVAGLVASLLLSARCMAGSIYVATNNTGPVTNGASWSTAYRTVSAALGNANPGDTLYLAGHTFNVTTQINWSVTRVAISGGYAATNAADTPGPFDPARWPTRLRASGQARVLNINGVSGTLSRVTIEKGYLNNNVQGIGISINSSTVRLDTCSIVSNRVLTHVRNHYPKGAGIYLGGGKLDLTNCLFLGNVVTGGEANWFGYGRGGALYVTGGSLNIDQCTFQSNSVYSICKSGSYGGAICIEGGSARIRTCRFENNRATGMGQKDAAGGALYVSGTTSVTVDCSRIVANRTMAYGTGGGLYVGGAVVRNCLIVSNTAVGNGGGVHLASGKLLNCTLADNTTTEGGAGLYQTGGTVTNSIIYFNRRTANQNTLNVSKTGGTLAYSCTTPAVAGTSNRTDNPVFANLAAGDYHLMAGSPCVDAGTNQAWMASLDDLDGITRVRNGRPDLGAYESTPPNEGPLRCGFTASGDTGIAPLTTVFTATAAGTNTAGLYYRWDFENNASWDRQGTTADTVTNSYGAGRWSVRLLVSNAVGETASLLRSNLVFSGATQVYVSQAGNGNGGTNWATAHTNIQTALQAVLSNATIHVAGQTFSLTGQLFWSSHRSVQILGGYEGTGTPGNRDPRQWNTILRPDASGKRVLFVSGVVSGTLSGVTVAHVNMNTTYGAVHGTNSSLLIADCVFSNNVLTGGNGAVRYGSALTLWSCTGQIRDTVFITNRIVITCSPLNYPGDALGGALHLNGGAMAVERCVFRRNAAEVTSSNGGTQTSGGAVYVGAGTHSFRNCVIVQNRTKSTILQQGGGLYLSAGSSLHHVTVATNWMQASGTFRGPGIYVAGGTISNSIVCHNMRSDGVSSNIHGSLAAFKWTCAPELSHGVDGNITNDPQFADLVYVHLKSRAGRYQAGYFSGGAWTRDSVDSPCIDAAAALLPFGAETYYNGKRANMGAYGNSAVASRTFVLYGTVFLIL